MTKYLPYIANSLFFLWLIAQTFADYHESRGWQLLWSIVVMVFFTLCVGVWAGSITK